MLPKNTFQSEPVESPYKRAKQAWDDRIGSVYIERNFLRGLVILLMIVSSVSLIGNFFLLTKKSMAIPYVVELKPTGEPSILGSAESLSVKAKDRVVKFFLRRFLLLAREIPADPVIFKRNWKKIPYLLSAQGKSILASVYENNSPNEQFKLKNRAIKIVSILTTAKDNYQVDWHEAEYNKKGQKIAEYPMRGSFKLARFQSQDEETLMENPLGVFIDYFSWTKLGG